MSTKIEAWEAEDASLVVWGTHDPFEAKYAYNHHIVEALSHVDEEFLTSVAEWEDDARKLWADPAIIHKATWEPGDYAEEPIDGWTPYLVLSR